MSENNYLISNNTANPLVDKICNVNRIVNEIYFNVEAKNNFESSANYETNMEKSEKKTSSKILNYIVCLLCMPLVTFYPVFFLVAISLYYLEEWEIIRVENANILYWVFGIVMATLSISMLICLSTKKRKRIKNHHDAAIIYQNQARRKENIVNELIQKHSEELEILPSKYRYPLATNYIEELFLNGRATTIPEALDKFEEQKHRWTVERNQQTIILQNAHQASLLENIWLWM